jgi:aminomethyltransferase
VSWTKGDFRGRDALEAQRSAGVTPVLRGLLVEGRRPPRADQVVEREGAVVGTVSSGNFSPTLEHGIALAFLTPDVETGDAVSIDMRGAQVPATVADLPFVAKKS